MSLYDILGLAGREAHCAADLLRAVSRGRSVLTRPAPVHVCVFNFPVKWLRSCALITPKHISGPFFFVWIVLLTFAAFQCLCCATSLAFEPHLHVGLKSFQVKEECCQFHSAEN